MQRSVVSKLCPGALSIALAICALSGDGTSQAAPWVHPDGSTHWYEAVTVAGGVTWDEAHTAAAMRGGYLATITSNDENDVIFKLIDRPELWSQDPVTGEWDGPWTGGAQLPNRSKPGEGWGWVELESFTYTKWAAGRPNAASSTRRIHFGGSKSGRASTWVDCKPEARRSGFVVEYAGPFVHQTVGLFERTPSSFDGYTLISPIAATETFLVDPRGRVVHKWKSSFLPGLSAYLLPNGNLLRAGNVGHTGFTAGKGGIAEEYDWNGNLVWQHKVATQTEVQHHDIERLPNGNTLMIVWFIKTKAEAVAAGRDPNLVTDEGVWGDKVIEVDKSGRVVWQWSVWDHLIQDHDSTKANHGPVAKHPELVDLNYGRYVGGPDWLHVNAVAYNPRLDQVMISVRHFDELWVIDHSTTTAQAAGHTGGRSGRGGDLLYRWGNPIAYRAGTANDRRLFQQHDAHWIPDSMPGGGNILIFNNGVDRPGGDASSVDEVVPPKTDTNGNYPRTGTAWGPANALWTHPRSLTSTFHSRYISGAQRLPNGNTLICEGLSGHLLEVTPKNQTTWDYVNPVDAGVALRQGSVPAASRNGVFRAYRYAPDYPAFQGKTLVPGDPLATYGLALLADGAMLRRRAKLQTSIALSLYAPTDTGRFYIAGTSATPGVIPIDSRHVRLGFDALLLPSMIGEAPSVFSNYVGTIDANGRARAAINLPQLPPLIGLDLHTMFLVLDFAAPNWILRISNTVVVHIDR